MKEIILASASERRSQILSSCNISHRIVVSGAEESLDMDRSVFEIVQINALSKAEIVAVDAGKSVVIGADTLVAHGKDIIGKPAAENAARDMLVKFSGSDIEVYTGLCVIDVPSDRKAVGFEKSSLRAVPLTAEDAEKYFRLLAPYDKAGGFSIEGVGAFLFDNIKGSYFNILGLPLIKLGKLFEEIGLDILDYVKK
ncbi:MAG: Maf family protein [Candidatus Omnitrophota bacterium]